MEKDYFVIQESDAKEVEKEVKSYLKEGYICNGNLLQGKDIDGEYYYIQAMIKV